MSTYVIVPYYNTIPRSATYYFTILDNTLIVSDKDMLGNSSNFLKTSVNKSIYIFSGPNMGTFTVFSLKSSTNISNTFDIKLNSIPPGLTDQTLCVLSLNPTAYTIDRTFVNLSNKINTNGNFTLKDKNIILINTSSINDDDETLFIYILATNKSFNIINYENKSSYVITNVILNNIQDDEKYISLIANIPILPLIEDNLYEINISTETASTISNTTINNTPISPILDSSVIIPTKSIPAYTPEYTTEKVTPVIIPIIKIDHKKHVNHSKKYVPIVNNTAILSYVYSGPIITNGCFKLSNKNDNTMVDLYTNVEHLETPNSNVSNSNVSNSNPFINMFTTAYQKITGFATQTYQSQIKPDILDYIPIIIGDKYKLSISIIDSFNKRINFIKQHSLMYITSGINTVILGTTTIPIYKNTTSNSIINCNVIINSPLPHSNNSSYILSTEPISQFITLMYKTGYNISTIIDSGFFTILSISAKNKSPTIIISNYDILYNTNVSSFTNLLYTIIQNPMKTSTPPYLNILNSDYSLVCTLEILHVIPDEFQTTFTYSIIDGASNLSNINDKSNYVFSLLYPSDFLSDDGILNRTTQSKQKLIRYNNLIHGASDAINKSLKSNQYDSNLINASNIMSDTLEHSYTLVNMPTPKYYTTITNALLTNTYNAILFGLKTEPNNENFNLIFNEINKLVLPLITLSILNNVENHINDVYIKNPNNQNLLNILNDIKNIKDNLLTSEIVDNNKLSLINAIITQINSELSKDSLNNSLIKAKNMLSNITSSSDIISNHIQDVMKTDSNDTENDINMKLSEGKMSNNQITEKMENVNTANTANKSNKSTTSNTRYQLIFAIIIFVITIAFLINNSKK